MPTTRDEPMPWLKLWHRFLDSAKIQILSESLRARYVNLLCVACKENANGKLPGTEMVGHMLRLSADETQSTLDSLAQAGLIESRAKSYYIHDWGDWQVQKTPAAVRQQRVRDKRNALRNGYVTESVTNGVTNSATRALAPPSGVLCLESSSEGVQGKPTTEPGPEFTTLGHLAIEMSSVLALGPWVSNMALLGHSAAAVRFALEEGAAAGKWDQRWLQGILKRVAVEGLPAAPNGHAPTTTKPPKPKRTAEEQEKLDAAAARNAQR